MPCPSPTTCLQVLSRSGLLGADGVVTASNGLFGLGQLVNSTGGPIYRIGSAPDYAKQDTASPHARPAPARPPAPVPDTCQLAPHKQGSPGCISPPCLTNPLNL